MYTMKTLMFIFLAYFVLSDAEVMIRNEVEVSSDRKTDDLWCLRNEDCAEDSMCFQHKCFFKGNALMSDLGNCMEIDVRGFNAHNGRIWPKDKVDDPSKWSIHFTNIDPVVIAVDGVYSIIQDKSSNGGKAFEKLGNNIEYGLAQRIRAHGIDLYLYWDTSRKQWTFDTSLQTQQDVVARSDEVADDTESSKRFEYFAPAINPYNKGETKRIHASLRCTKYLGASEESEISYSWGKDQAGQYCDGYTGPYDSLEDARSDCIAKVQAGEDCLGVVAWNCGARWRLCTRSQRAYGGNRCYSELLLEETATTADSVKEDQIAAENERLRKSNRALQQLLNEMAV